MQETMVPFNATLLIITTVKHKYLLFKISHHSLLHISHQHKAAYHAQQLWAFDRNEVQS